jgi:iron complex transport system substrate-binding protein
VSAAPRRVVSLLPSATEIVHALGLGDRLVGRSHECDFPAQAAGLPACTRARFADGSSREIDDRVGDLVSRGLSLYDVDVDQLRELRPDLVLTQDQCAVCAVHLSDVETALAEWTGGEVRVLSLSPSTLGDVFGDITRVGEVLGESARARELTTDLADRISQIGEKTGGLVGDERPSVACLEWIDPLMAAGNWMPELVTLAGGRPLLGETGRHSPGIAWEDLRSADPDVLVVTACGFDLERTALEMGPLLAHPDWPSLRAVSSGRVFLTDGNAYFNRSGPRLVDSLEILAEVLHPERFDFGHEGRGWRRI